MTRPFLPTELSRQLIAAMIAIFALVLACGASASATTSHHGTAAIDGGSFCERPSLPSQVAPSAFEVRLGLDQKSTRPGGALRMRIENLGTQSVAYGLAYELARFQKGAWVKLPTGPFFAPLLSVPAETASKCQTVDIPRHALPGLYRIRKLVRPAAPPRHPQRAVTATFRVKNAS